MFYIFSTNFGYWEKINDHERLKQKYFKIIQDDLNKNKKKFENDLKWNCECKTSFFNEKSGLELFEDDFLNSVIWNPMDNMLNELQKIMNFPVPKSSNIFKIWYNTYEVGEWQEVHDHKTKSTSICYSGIYILELNEPNTTSFIDNRRIDCWNMDESISCFYTSDVNITEGSVILFPSELLHYVNPCKNNRTTISFNITSTF